MLFHCSRLAFGFAIGAACLANGHRTVVRFSRDMSLAGRMRPVRMPNGWTITERTLLYGDRDAIADISSGQLQASAVVIDGMEFVRDPENFEAWLNDVSGACVARGILQVMDETQTGFRLAYGGLQEHLGFEADLTVYGSMVGGSLPLAAVVARENALADVNAAALNLPSEDAHEAPFDPFAVSAGIATLSVLSEHRDAIYSQLFASGKFFRDDVNGRLKAAGLDGRCTGAGPIVSLAPVLGGLSSSGSSIAQWRRALYDRGIVVGRSEIVNLSTAHTEHDLHALAPEIADAAVALNRVGAATP